VFVPGSSQEPSPAGLCIRQVTGIRQEDAWANANRIPVEEDKPEVEQGYYLHPELFDQPEEMGIEWAHRSENMRQMQKERDAMRESANAPP